MSMGNTPILILKEGTKRDKGKDAQYNNIMAARAIADAVRSTLGPRGMDKMLVDTLGDVVITNDGVTILKEIDVDHPAAKMLVEVAKTQDEECGDGTTTAVILAGELLKKAVDLIDANVHPTVITYGYRLAASKAMEVLDASAIELKVEDRGNPHQDRPDRHDVKVRGRIEGTDGQGVGRRREEGRREERQEVGRRHGQHPGGQEDRRLDGRHHHHRRHHRRQGTSSPGHAEEGREGQ